jgi:hypothetical protein
LDRGELSTFPKVRRNGKNKNMTSDISEQQEGNSITLL